MSSKYATPVNRFRLAWTTFSVLVALQADICAVLSRVSMLEKVQYAADAGHFIFPWTHDGRSEDIVFKIVATIPMVASKAGVVQERVFQLMSKN